MGNLGGWEILIILGVLVLLFGAKRLPDMARSMGQSARVFKGEMKGLQEDSKRDKQEPTVQPGYVAPVRDVEPSPQMRTDRSVERETPGSTAQ